MKTQIENYNNEIKEVELNFDFQRIGSGIYQISCAVLCDGEKNVINLNTTDSRFIDKIIDMREDNESYDDIQKEYYSKFGGEFEMILISMLG